MKNGVLILISSLFLFSCSENTQEIVNSPIVVTATEAEYYHLDTAYHYEVDLKYPVIDANLNPEVLNKINNLLPEKFHQFTHQNEFIEAHLNLPKDFFSDIKDWQGVLTNSYRIHQADSLLFISFSVYQYFIGAAHGATQQYALRFDLNSGEEIPITQLIQTDTAALQQIKKLINSQLPDSVCWGIQNDSNIIPTIQNMVFIKDSVLFYMSDYILCPYAFGVSDIRFSNEQISPLLKITEIQYFSEIDPVVDEGEIATH